KDEAAGRFKDAERNVKSALMYDLQNAAYKAKLAEVTDALERTRDKTEALKIK
ncbi:MAG: molecular chaperone DnaJ, partial [Deltaproteobacteria bacterium]|nr:molecular chaperone DnaJ [Deltaproteobacteria bacterium]